MKKIICTHNITTEADLFEGEAQTTHAREAIYWDSADGQLHTENGTAYPEMITEGNPAPTFESQEAATAWLRDIMALDMFGIEEPEWM